MATSASIDSWVKKNPQKVVLSPLHIKLGLMKNAVKSMNQNDSGSVGLVQISKDQQGQNQRRDIYGPAN